MFVAQLDWTELALQFFLKLLYYDKDQYIYCKLRQ